MMGEKYFSKTAIGGQIASRVDSQDSVAATITLDLIRGGIEPLVPLSQAEPIEIFCEGQEDLEVVQASKVLLVSVKDRIIGIGDIRREIAAKLEPRLRDKSSDDIYLRISCLRGIDSKARSFASDVGHLRTRLSSEFGWREAAPEFQRKWQIDPAIAARVWIDDRNLGRTDQRAEALFAHVFRLAFPTTTLTERGVKDIHAFLADQIFAPARRNRERVDLLQVEHELVELIAPRELRLLASDLKVTPFGYVASGDLRSASQEIHLVRGVMRKVMKHWRKVTFFERATLLRVNCMYCDHPMMANLGGRNGYACPKCGFIPFGSLFYACDCGAPVLIESNPQVGGAEFLTYAIRRTRDKNFKCEQCNLSVDPRKAVFRLFFAPIPWPVPANVDSILLAKRIALGWGKGGLTPEDAEARMLAGDHDDWKQHLAEAEGISRRDRIKLAVLRVLALAILVALLLKHFM